MKSKILESDAIYARDLAYDAAITAAQNGDAALTLRAAYSKADETFAVAEETHRAATATALDSYNEFVAAEVKAVMLAYDSQSAADARIAAHDAGPRLIAQLKAAQRRMKEATTWLDAAEEAIRLAPVCPFCHTTRLLSSRCVCRED